MFHNVLLTIDLGQESSWKKALPTALELAGCSPKGTLHVLTVVPDVGMSIVGQFFPKNFEDDIAAKVMEALHAWVKTHVPDGVRVRHIVGEGTVYEVILDVATKVAADVIVLAAHRPELKDYLLGPNAARVVRHAACSVMVVRD